MAGSYLVAHESSISWLRRKRGESWPANSYSSAIWRGVLIQPAMAGVSPESWQWLSAAGSA